MRGQRRLAFVIVIVAMLATACGPMKPSSSQAQKDVEQMMFVRHQNGLYFGVVRFLTYAGHQGVSIAAVPSEACR